MSTLQITRKTVSVVKESSSDVFVNLSDQVGGLVLKEGQKLAVEALLSGKDVMAVLPNDFGKSIIYQSFVLNSEKLCHHGLDRGCFSASQYYRLDSKIIKRHWCQLVQSNFCIRGTSFVGRIHRRMLKHDINNSFPVVLYHVLNYTSGVCVVDFFYSGPRRKIQMHHNF